MTHKFNVKVRTYDDLENLLSHLPRGWEVEAHGWLPGLDGFEAGWARIKAKGRSKRRAYLQLVRIKDKLGLDWCRITALKSSED